MIKYDQPVVSFAIFAPSRLCGEVFRLIKQSSPTSNAVLLSEEDWNAIQETLYHLAVPGMRESIKAGMAEPLTKSEELKCVVGRLSLPGKRLRMQRSLLQAALSQGRKNCMRF